MWPTYLFLCFWFIFFSFILFPSGSWSKWLNCSIGNSKQNQEVQNWLVSRVNIYPPSHWNLLDFNVLLPGYSFFFVPLLLAGLIICSMFWFVSCGNSCSMEFDNPERPECNNLLSIYQLISGKTKEVIFIGVLSAKCKILLVKNFEYLMKMMYHLFIC